MSKRTNSKVMASPSSGSNGVAKSSSGGEVSLDSQTLLLSASTGHFTLFRALQLADFLTELNGFCGVMSVFSSLKYCLQDDPRNVGNLYWALAFLPFGLFFDFMDGKVARWRKKSSMMGQELDSLADLISFGIAPAVVAFCLGFRSLVDTICLSCFVLCGLTRLARFNVTVQVIPKDTSGKAQYFEGTPIPTTLGLDSIMAVWIHNGWILDDLPFGIWAKGTALEFHPLVLLFVLHGCLMTSKTLKIPKL